MPPWHCRALRVSPVAWPSCPAVRPVWWGFVDRSGIAGRWRWQSTRAGPPAWRIVEGDAACGHFRTGPSYLPELRDYLQTLLRNRERILAATALDEWAATEATPSDEEITRLRALIRRTEEAVDDLSTAEQGALHEATAALRKVRTVQHLGMPGTTPPHLDPRLERDV